MKNWRGLWLANVILAQKIWDDHPLKTSAFCSILPCVSKRSLKDIELAAFCLPNFSTGVKPSQYAKCYFGLRELYSEMILHNKGNDQFNLKPLSLLESLRLEDRSFRNGYLRHGVYHSHSRHHHKHRDERKRNGDSSSTSTMTGSTSSSALSSVLTTPMNVSFPSLTATNKNENLQLTNTTSSSKSAFSERVFSKMLSRSIYNCNIAKFSTLEFFPYKTFEDATVVNNTRFVIS
jgi:hypothetical protein